VSESELIFCNSFGRLSSPFLINGTLEELPTLFNRAAAQPDKKFVVVTSGSDYGLHYQSEEHPNKDLLKRVNALPWEEIISRRDSYAQISPILSIEPGQCAATDKYSIKVDRHTKLTLNEWDIPSNVVRWFSTNLNVIHPRIRWLPFGINHHGSGWEYLQKKQDERPAKDIDLFICFTSFTEERLRLNDWASTFTFPAQLRVVYREVGMPVEEYLDYVSRSKYVLCSCGNGLDSFRVYESLYLGATPTVGPSYKHFWGGYAAYFPLAYYSNLEELMSAVGAKQRKCVNGEFLKLSFWTKQIEEALKECQ
jgi:hypothetical protein